MGVVLSDMDKQLKLLKSIDPDEYNTLLGIVGQIEKLETVQNARVNFMDFVKVMWPGFISGGHHKQMAKIAEDVIAGRETRVVVNLAPRHTKSEFFSYLLPAWALGLHPSWKIIQICATSDMAIGWSRKVRNLVMSEEYQKIFPGTGLRADSKAAGRWHTSGNGEYFAVGAEGNVTGKGGDLVIIDDPTGEQQAVSAIGDPSVYNKVYDWFIAGPRQRLQPGGRIVVVQSRWATNDFTGRLLKAQVEADSEKADKWNVVELPAILPSGKPLWPEYWSLDSLEATRIALPPNRWNAQYMQMPSNDSSSIIKREWWRRWKTTRPPECSIKMVAVDTAYSQKETADFTAFTTWGVFDGESERTDKDPGGKTAANIILLDAWQERLDFPELKAIAHKHWLKWQPDVFMVESKAAGAPLIYELRARGVPVSEFSVSRGTRLAPNDKIARTNAIADIFASGLVWCPETRWAEDVIEQCADFPNALNDDMHDTVVMALTRFRQGGFIRLATDSWDDENESRPRRRAYY
tara:strand:- start:41 stop:1603 length:1563 start_codon:yes stop_codon:yes gene_type:complete